jgi:hypothetical protein
LFRVLQEYHFSSSSPSRSVLYLHFYPTTNTTLIHILQSTTAPNLKAYVFDFWLPWCTPYPKCLGPEMFSISIFSDVGILAYI